MKKFLYIIALPLIIIDVILLIITFGTYNIDNGLYDDLITYINK